MVFDSLGEYVQALDSHGELHKVKAPVDVDLEIAEILRRVMYERGPAVIFENVKGFEMPVLGNAFGSMTRLGLVFGTSNFEELGTRITDLMKMELPTGFFDKIKALPRLDEIAKQAPRVIKSGPVEEVVETSKPSFNSLPISKTWPKDAGRFITFGLVATKNPETGVRNLGVYRMQIYDTKTAAMHWQIHKRGAQHHKIAIEQKKKIEAAVIIGADPITIFSAVAPVPEGLDKFLFSGIMRKKGVELIKCRTIDLEIPATSEIVLEGYVNPDEMRIEGPFGDHTGFYTPPEPYPVFHLTGIMRRKHPIYLTTVVGKPVLEDAYLGKVIERSFVPIIRLFHPEVVDLDMPASGWFQGLAIVSIKKRYPGQAKKVMLGLWSMGQMSLTKILVVVDDTVDIHNIDEVIWAVTTHTDPRRDIMILENVPADSLDHTSPLLNLGSKMGIDATTKWREEGYEREWPEIEKVDPQTEELVDKRWNEYGFSSAQK